MGRHAAPAPARRATSRGQEVAAWGAFTVPLTVVVLILVGVSWGSAVAVGVLGAAAFAVVAVATHLLAPAGAQDTEPDDAA